MPMSNYPDPPAFPLFEFRYHTMPTTSDEPKRRRRREGGSERERARDRDRDSTSSRDKHTSSSQKPSTSKLHRRRGTSTERDRDRLRSTVSERVSRKPVEVTALPEMRTASGSDTRPKTSYPTFSKAHSKEDVRSLQKPITPPATDVSAERRRNSTPAKPPANTPPSPPLTAENPAIRRSDSGGSIRQAADEARANIIEGKRSMESPRKANMKQAKSGASLTEQAIYGQSEISSMPGAFPEEERTTPSSGSRRTVSTASQSTPHSVLTQNTQLSGRTGDSHSTIDSAATTVPPERKAQRPLKSTQPKVEIVHNDSVESVTDSQPRTPVQDYISQPPLPRKTPIIEVDAANLDTPQSFGMTPSTAVPPPPPPPPPPLASNREPPRVDYLLKNGGLPTLVPKRLVNFSPAVQQYSMYQSAAILQQAPLEEYSKVFSTIHKRLDDYLQVLRTSGSLAVATGYKSVARRLLDKLSQVFARDISSQRCDCVICKTTPQPTLSDEEDSGISWGEILEIVSGRRDLPLWPPFSIASEDTTKGLGTSGTAAGFQPMQKLDIDVPEEYKDHFLRQNQKTKRAIQSWLAQQPEFPSSPPEEADEDTLMFAMMTRLSVHERNYFIALMHGQSSISDTRAPTPAERPAQPSTALRRANKALQRLYRLEKPPRDCESAMYLLREPELHGMLATLAEVNEAEWEILVSGRFDGFLWSGAEAPMPPSVSQFASPVGSRAPSRGVNGMNFARNTTPFSSFPGMLPSRGPTPFSPLRNAVGSPDATPGHYQPSMFPSRGPTPGLGGMGVAAPGPVQMDEDTEIAVLAEVERNLFNDMERFEDAFEILHSRAELVRQMLRERSAGLSMQAQLRRGSNSSDAAFVRLDTPASGVTDGEDEDDDGLGDVASLAPDDSASQISFNRRHRRRHVRENRTPAPVAEEDESAFEEVVKVSKRDREREHGGRRSKY